MPQDPLTDDALLKPIASGERLIPKTSASSHGLATALKLFGAGLALLSFSLAIYFYIRDMPATGTGTAAEYIGQAALFAFLGGFGVVPGVLLFVAGRTSSKNGTGRALGWKIAAFAVPFLGLAGFLLFQGGVVWGLLALVIAALILSLARFAGRSQ